MHRLTLLGRISLQRASGIEDGAANRPRPLALLAILATAGRVGLARDKCLVYLWPESDTQHARNSLHQTLHALRSDLGPDAIQSGTHILLNPAHFSVDLWDFEAALTADDAERAIALYGGPFLDGFAIDNLPEFDEWLASERLRISRRYATALERSARLAAERGDHERAVHQWRVRTQLDPLSAPPTLGLMQALVDSGDRASAIACGHDYELLVRRELACDPDPSITEFIATIRSGTSRSTPTGRSPGPGQSGATPVISPPPRATEPDDPLAIRARRRLRIARVAALLSLVAFSIAVAWKWTARPVPPEHSPQLIAVFPFTIAGTPETQYLGDGLVDLLSNSLDGAGSIRGVDPRALLGWLESRHITAPNPTEASAVARRFGAGRYVLGSVAGSGSRLRLLATLYDHDRPDSALATAASEGEAGDLFRLVDDLTAQLLAAALPEPRHRLVRVAASTTASLPALKNYLDGEQKLRDGEYLEAADAFTRAIQLDTTFALAWYRLGIAADWLGRDSVADAAADAAVRLSGRLSEHDALLVRAAVASRQGDAPGAEQLYRRIVVDYPDDLEAWLQLAEVLFHGNPLRGRSAVEARIPYERVLALDPDDEEALLHLARIAALEEKHAEVDSLARRLLRLAPNTEVLELRAFRAFALGDRDSWKRVTRELRDNPPDVPPVTALEVALFLDDLDGTERFARILIDGRYSEAVRALGYRLLARAAAARGQWDAAAVQLDSARRHDEVTALELRSLLASLDFLHVPLEEVRAIRDDVERWDVNRAGAGATEHSASHTGLHGAIRRYRLGLLDARLGDTRAALAQADSLEREGALREGRAATVFATLASSVRAHVSFSLNDAAGALRHLEQARWPAIESGFEAEAGDRYLRAVALESLGRDQEALAWYRTIAERATHELVYVAPSRLRAAVVYCRLGDHGGAIDAYTTGARLWRQGNATQLAQVAATDRRLRELGVTIPATPGSTADSR